MIGICISCDNENSQITIHGNSVGDIIWGSGIEKTETFIVNITKHVRECVKKLRELKSDCDNIIEKLN